MIITIQAVSQTCFESLSGLHPSNTKVNPASSCCTKYITSRSLRLQTSHKHKKQQISHLKTPHKLILSMGFTTLKQTETEFEDALAE